MTKNVILRGRNMMNLHNKKCVLRDRKLLFLLKSCSLGFIIVINAKYPIKSKYVLKFCYLGETLDF